MVAPVEEEEIYGHDEIFVAEENDALAVEEAEPNDMDLEPIEEQDAIDVLIYADDLEADKESNQQVEDCSGLWWWCGRSQEDGSPGSVLQVQESGPLLQELRPSEGSRERKSLLSRFFYGITGELCQRGEGR